LSKSPLDNLTTLARQQLLELERERFRRSIEPLKLYVPNDYQKPLHECQAKEIVVLGGNRSGKSVSVMVELAWAATGTHPVKGKYPDGALNIGIVGKGYRHIGLVLYPYLFKSGSFHIIKDEVTGIWRAYHPLKDKDRKAERKPAPPLIPPRHIKNQSWTLKAANYISTCELHNGTNLWFFSSDADPQQGMQLDLLVIDEDIDNEAWLPEGQARLADRQGRLIWSAMPHSRCDALLGLSERADKAAEEGRDHIKKFTFRFLDNPFIDPEEKARMIERWAALGEDVLRMRAEGEFTYDSMLVYPTWNPSVHGLDASSLPNSTVPDDWCRYAVVDPGHSVTAVLFAAVPPDESMVLLYDELYIRNCNAIIFGQEFHKKVAGKQFHAFLIDSHGARLTDIGSGKSPQDQYTEQLVALGIRSRVTGASFIPGSDDILAGLQSVRNMMHIRSGGTPKLRVLRGALPNLERELRRYKKKTQSVGGSTIVLDEPNKRGEFHLVDCLRYLCSYEPEYHRPVSTVEVPWYVKWKEKRDKANANSGVVYLSPNSYTETWVA